MLQSLHWTWQERRIYLFSCGYRGVYTTQKLCVNYKMQIYKNGDIMCMHITCSVNRHDQVSLQSDVANCWPSMDNTAFLVVFLFQYNLVVKMYPWTVYQVEYT